MFGLREPSHWLFLILVVVILFGAKRLPDSARSLGRSLRIFKSEVKELNKDEKKDDEGDKASS
jgi:sec-independent protein translocase protein TatA